MLCDAYIGEYLYTCVFAKLKMSATLNFSYLCNSIHIMYNIYKYYIFQAASNPSPSVASTSAPMPSLTPRNAIRPPPPLQNMAAVTAANSTTVIQTPPPITIRPPPVQSTAIAQQPTPQVTARPPAVSQTSVAPPPMVLARASNPTLPVANKPLATVAPNSATVASSTVVATAANTCPVCNESVATEVKRIFMLYIENVYKEDEKKAFKNFYVSMNFNILFKI